MNKLFTRILSFVLAVSLLSYPLSVFASSDDTVSSENLDDILSSYASQIKNQTIEFYTTYNVEVNQIDDLWSTFIASWKVSQATAYYGLSTAKLIAGCLKDFIKWLRDNYFYAFFENNVEYHYVSPAGKLPSHDKIDSPKQSELLPSEDFYPYGDSIPIHTIGFDGQYPFTTTNNYDARLKNLDFSAPHGELNTRMHDGTCGVFVWTSYSYNQSINYKRYDTLSSVESYIKFDDSIGDYSLDNNGHDCKKFYHTEITNNRLYYYSQDMGYTKSGTLKTLTDGSGDLEISLGNETHYDNSWGSMSYARDPVYFHGDTEYCVIWGNCSSNSAIRSAKSSK